MTSASKLVRIKYLFREYVFGADLRLRRSFTHGFEGFRSDTNQAHFNEWTWRVTQASGLPITLLTDLLVSLSAPKQSIRRHPISASPRKFSSRCRTDEVPRIGNITWER